MKRDGKPIDLMQALMDSIERAQAESVPGDEWDRYVNSSPSPGPTAMDPGGSEGMVTDPPTVTIPEERAYLIFDPEDGEVFGAEDENLSTFAVSRERALGMAAEYRSAVDAGLMDWHVVRLVTADEWDAITARLARLDAIEALMRRIDAEDDDTECDRLWGELLRAIDGAS